MLLELLTKYKISGYVDYVIVDQKLNLQQTTQKLYTQGYEGILLKQLDSKYELGV